MRRRRLTKALVPGGCVALIVLIALAAPLLPLPDPIRQDVAHRLAGPMAGSWLGRDEFGRDVLSRLVWGPAPASPSPSPRRWWPASSASRSG